MSGSAPDALPAIRSGAVTTEGGDRPRFMAFIADENSEAALRGGLADVVEGMQVRRGNIRSATKALEREQTPRVLLVDIAGVEDPVAALDELATVCTPDVRVLVVGEQTGIGFYRELTRDLGVAEYIHKPLTRDAVARLFAPHLAGASAEEHSNRGGRIIAVCGVRGGAGATTIAVNLALQLADASRSYVALVDLHLRGGTAAMMLGARPGSGMRAALEEPDRVDALFLDRVGIPVDERVRLFAAEEPWETDPHPSEDGVRRLFSTLRQRFNSIVVDMPMPPTAADKIALQEARHRVLVMAPDVASIRDAVALKKMMGGLGGSARVLTVLNRAGCPGALKTKLIEEGLGAAPDLVVPDLPRFLPRAANLGRPALRESSQFRRALAPLTQEISAVRAAGSGGSFFARLFGRS